ncbi:flavodoxin [Malaciobacter molluscorum LMG 25693]|uniref:Flavodoxin n=1 Tax=Malaciobacter molluscorum LMG 25693 TaxID=870501 RepID=A0A2G1DEM5_9BACT|nr:flavodoxin [Malaciobacter molluscorum]AXX93080.1 flavodoxin [Malaciobacter molluscorum LMG 25693]PHO16952.1 flavodoxin [Malaciobacter molluscorum LMG 25693]
MATAIFYASSTGNTEEVVDKIAQKLEISELFNISNNQEDINKISEYDKLILATSTWGDGDLQDDWDEIWDEFKQIDFSNKTVALVALGDQDGYDDTFVNSLGTMYEQVIKQGANVIGFTSTDGYDFEESTALKNDQFVGLVIDEDNQDDLTDERIENWTNQIKNQII